MASVNLPTFTPPDESVADILAALIDPSRTLRSVADQFRTSVEALALWMQRPDVAPRLNALSAATAFRARALALDLLPSAISILRDALDEYADQLRRPKPDPKPHRAQAARRHAADDARRAIGLLSRLARLLPPTITPSPPQRTSPEGEDRLERSDKQVGVRAASIAPEPKDAVPHAAPSPASGKEQPEAQPSARDAAQDAAANPNANTPASSVAEAQNAPRQPPGCPECPKSLEPAASPRPHTPASTPRPRTNHHPARTTGPPHPTPKIG